jgi:ribosome maturation factor RimP
MRRHGELEALILPVVTGFGCTWWGLQYFPQGKKSLLRLYIDKPGGVTLEDCERVSRQVDALLGVEGPLQGDYTLEVSSPGIDRVLFTAAQCEQFLGKEVSVRLRVPMDGKRNFKGKLQRVDGESVCILLEGTEAKEIVFSFTEIDEARLVPKW